MRSNDDSEENYRYQGVLLSLPADILSEVCHPRRFSCDAPFCPSPLRVSGVGLRPHGHSVVR